MPVPVPVQSFITGSKYPNASSWDWLSPPLNTEDNHILRPHHFAGVYTLHLNDGEYHQHLLHFIDHWARFCNIGLTPSSPHLKEIILTYLLLLLHVLFQGLSLISFCCREEGGSPPTYTTLHYHLCPPQTPMYYTAPDSSWGWASSPPPPPAEGAESLPPPPPPPPPPPSPSTF